MHALSVTQTEQGRNSGMSVMGRSTVVLDELRRSRVNPRPASGLRNAPYWHTRHEQLEEVIDPLVQYAPDHLGLQVRWID